jgi:hypothetical protein
MMREVNEELAKTMQCWNKAYKYFQLLTPYQSAA